MSNDLPAFIDEPVVDPSNMTDRQLLIRMDGKLSTGFALLFQSHTIQVELGNDHEKRIRAVEKAVWYMAGIAAVLGVVGSQLLQTILPAAGH